MPLQKLYTRNKRRVKVPQENREERRGGEEDLSLSCLLEDLQREEQEESWEEETDLSLP